MLYRQEVYHHTMSSSILQCTGQRCLPWFWHLDLGIRLAMIHKFDGMTCILSMPILASRLSTEDYLPRSDLVYTWWSRRFFVLVSAAPISPLRAQRAQGQRLINIPQTMNPDKVARQCISLYCKMQAAPSKHGQSSIEWIGTYTYFFSHWNRRW